MFQMKEQAKSPERELNKMEVNKLPDKEFKTLVIRMLNELRRRINDLSENFNKEIVNIKQDTETIKKNQSEVKNTITEIKNTLEGINIRFDEAEN